MYKLLLSLFLITIICSSTDAFAQELTLYQYDGGVLLRKDKTDENGNIDFAFSPNATAIYMLWDGKGKWIKGDPNVEPPAQAILDMHEAKKPLNGGRKPVVQIIKDEIKKQKEYSGPRVGDTVVEDKLRSGKVTKVTKDYVTIEVKIPMAEITPMVGVVGKFPIENLPPHMRPNMPRRKPDAIIRNRQ